MVGWLRGLRPSNLVLIVASPFLVWLFATDEAYLRSLVFILGVEDNAGAVFVTFLLLLLATGLGIAVAIDAMRGRPVDDDRRKWGIAGLALHLLVIAWLALLHDLHPFWQSVVVDLLDARTSPWLVPDERVPTLSLEALASLDLGAAITAAVYGLFVAFFILRPLFTVGEPPTRRHAWLLLGVNLALLLYLLLFAHLSFATGLFITLRAAILAYVAASILGLGLAGLLGLGLGKRTLLGFTGAIAILALLAGVLLSRPHETWRLVGSLEGRVAIVSGTPARLSDAIKEGAWPGGDGERHSIRAADDVERALELLREDERITGAMLRIEHAPGDLPMIWEVSLLPDRFRTPGIALAVLALLLAIITFSAWQKREHPLRVFAEFFIDVIRGIPMLVIILYIGLPLSGALKDATGGFFDLPNMVRGMIAISIGYSAYMAEIFRAGIEAVPRGQIEAAQSLGLTRWQTARLVILPQALRVVIPPMGNELIAMIKDTSLLSILSVRDVTQRTREFQAASFLPFAPFNTAAILYVTLTLVAASGLKWVERRTERKER